MSAPHRQSVCAEGITTVTESSHRRSGLPGRVAPTPDLERTALGTSMRGQPVGHSSCYVQSVPDAHLRRTSYERPTSRLDRSHYHRRSCGLAGGTVYEE